MSEAIQSRDVALDCVVASLLAMTVSAGAAAAD